MNILDKLNKEGKTIIVVTHDPELARDYASTIYSVRDGKVEYIERRTNGKWKKEMISCKNWCSNLLEVTIKRFINDKWEEMK